MEEAGTDRSLAKRLGLLDVYAIATGATLSAGFFLLPGLAAAEAGPALPLAYLLAAVPLLPGILSKVELMTALPRAGGIYYFLDRSMGPATGTVGGLGIWLVLMLKVSFALVGMGAYLEIFLPGLPIVPVAVGLAVVVGLVNLWGAKLSGGLQVALVVGIVGILAAFMAFGVPAIQSDHFHDFLGAGPESLFATAGLVFVSYAGLTKPAAVAEEVADPERNLSLGVFLAFGTAAAVYAVGTAVIVGVLPMEQLRGDLTSVASAGGAVFGPWGVVLLTVAALLAFTAVTNAGTLSASRYPLAMSRDRVLPDALSKLNDRGMPSAAILLTVGSIVLIIVFLDPLKIAKLASAFKLLVFSLLCLAVVVMRESGIEEYDPGYRTPLYPWTQVVGIVAPLALIATMGWLTVLFSLGLVVGGAVWYRRYAKKEVVREGAVYHLFERLGRRRYEGLEDELRQILKEKGLREADPYGEMVGRAEVIQIEGEADWEEVAERASRQLAAELPCSADYLRRTFLEETDLGVTPVSHGAALPHVRLEGIEAPRLAMVRSVEGLRLVHDEEEREAFAPETEAGREPPEAPSGAAGAEAGGEPLVHAVFFLVSPEADARQHLRMLATLAERVEREDFLEAWLEARTERELKEVLLEEERYLSLRLEADSAAAPLIGLSLGETERPPGIVVTLLRRDGRVLDSEEGAVLKEGDRITFLGDPVAIATLRERYGGG